jgi:malate/lactate dehydrogenase
MARSACLSLIETGKAAKEVIADEAWVTDTFIPCIQKRGAAIIAARKLSSALSAAQVCVYAYKNSHLWTRKFTLALPLFPSFSLFTLFPFMYSI